MFGLPVINIDYSIESARTDFYSRVSKFGNTNEVSPAKEWVFLSFGSWLVFDDLNDVIMRVRTKKLSETLEQ